MFTLSDTGRILDVATQGGDLESRFVAMAQVLTNILGACNTPLEHRGDVTLRGDLTVDGDVNLPISLTGDNYAVAVSTWVRAALHGSYVMCRAATDPVGTLTDDAEPFIVYLPRSIATKDPNVYAGDILQYVTVNGINYAVGEAYLDAKIGTFRPMTLNSAINGWALCDGDGETPDLNGLFVRGAENYGATGGSNTHGHSGGISVDAATVTITGNTGSTNLSTTASSGTTGSSTTGISIADHPNHVHDLEDTCIVLQNATGPAVVMDGFTGPMLTDDGLGSLTYTHSVTDPGHDHSFGSHTHPVSPDPHNHSAGTLAASSHSHTGSATIGDGSNIPEYIDLVWYVRVGPTGEIA